MTLAEIAIATGITATVLGTAAGFVVPLHRALDNQRVRAEVEQRTRIAFHRLQRDLRDAGVWSRHPVSGTALVRPAILPFDVDRVGPARPHAQPDAMTLIMPSPRAVRVVTLSPLGPTTARVQVRAAPGCPPADRECRLEADTTVMIIDRAARSDFLRVTDVVADTVTVASLDRRVLPSYPAGAVVVPIRLRTYYFNDSNAQLRYRDGWMTNAPVVDDVVGLSFRYFGHLTRPSRLGHDGVQAPCLSSLQSQGGEANPGQVELALTELGDGPWCGQRPVFDADLFRVRRVRVDMRLQTPWIQHRGRNPLLFVRPGTATRHRQAHPDVSTHFEVTMRNAWLGR